MANWPYLRRMHKSFALNYSDSQTARLSAEYGMTQLWKKVDRNSSLRQSSMVHTRAARREQRIRNQTSPAAFNPHAAGHQPMGAPGMSPSLNASDAQFAAIAVCVWVEFLDKSWISFREICRKGSLWCRNNRLHFGSDTWSWRFAPSFRFLLP